MQRFLFRADVSPATGMGHLRRCLTLSRELSDKGGEIYFLCRAEGLDPVRSLSPAVKECRLMDWATGPEEDAQRVVDMCAAHSISAAIIDHYRAGESYQKILFASGMRWLQFDGAARSPFWADWVLNMSPAATDDMYTGLVKKDACRLLLGPEYAVIRREFRETAPRDRTHNVRRIILTFGGGSDRGAALFCLRAIEKIDSTIERIVLTSGTNPYAEETVKWCADHEDARVVIDVDDMASYMASADLAITAGGMTVFETASHGLPVIFLQIADNQVPITRAWEKAGYGINLGSFDTIRTENVLKEVISLIENTKYRKQMSDTGRKLVDGLGAERVARYLFAA